MTRFLISMPDAMLKDLDALARREQRSSSELLREAVRQYLGSTLLREASASYGKGTLRDQAKESMHDKDRSGVAGVGAQACPGLDRLFGPSKGRVDMRKVIAIGKKLSGLSSEIVQSRDDRM
jgi:predicted transcriptional regulator